MLVLSSDERTKIRVLSTGPDTCGGPVERINLGTDDHRLTFGRSPADVRIGQMKFAKSRLKKICMGVSHRQISSG